MLTLTHREYFDQKADLWDSLISTETKERLRLFVEELAISHGSQVLDVGTGTGVLLPYLVRAVGPQGRVVALDLAPRMLARARRKVTGRNVEFVEADVAAIPLPNESFDEVICNSAFPHFPEKIRASCEMARVLKPGGRLVIFHPESREAINQLHRSLGGVVANDLLPDEATMRTILAAAGLEVIKIEDTPHRYLVVGRKKAPE